MSSILKISCSVYRRGEKFCMVEMCLTGHAFQKYMLQKCSASIDSYPNHRVICHKNGNFHSFQLVHHLIDRSAKVSVVEWYKHCITAAHCSGLNFNNFVSDSFISITIWCPFPLCSPHHCI